MRDIKELADALAQAAADVRWAQDWRDVGDLLGALEQRARDAHEEVAAVVAERDRLRADFVRIADAVGLVSTDDTGRIGDVGTVDEVLVAIQRAVSESHAAVDSQLAYDEASSERDRLRREKTEWRMACLSAERERDRLRRELEALRDEMRERAHAEDWWSADRCGQAAYKDVAGRLDDILRGGES